MPTIDVVVPCYNYGRHLPDCIDSLLTQDGCDLRVLIVDDASTDGSAAVARALAAKDPRVSVLVHEANRGHIATYNEGIAWSSADYFLLLSADDALVPDALARAIAIMEARPEVSWTYGREIELRAGDTMDEAYARCGWRADAGVAWRVTPGADFIARLCETGWNHVPTCTAVVRGPVQKRAGGYRPDLPHSGDLEMWLRTSLLGAVAETDAFQGVRRMHAANMFNAYPGVRDLRQRQAAFESFFAEDGRALPDGPRLLARARRALARQAAQWGLAFLRRGGIRAGLECLAFATRLSPASAAAAPFAYLKRRWPGAQAAVGAGGAAS